MDPTSDYILMDFDHARAVKFKAGIDRHRNGDSTREFHGELCDEAYQECLDLYSYLEQIENSEHIDLTLRKSIVRDLANDLRKIHERHIG